jgi:hypothetical protein
MLQKEPEKLQIGNVHCTCVTQVAYYILFHRGTQVKETCCVGRYRYNYVKQVFMKVL